MSKIKLKISNVIIVGGLCVFLGVLLSVQLKTIKENDVNVNIQRSRDSSLETQIKQKDLEISALKQSLTEYQSEITQNDQIIEAEFNRANLLAGTLEVQGTGVEITLSDGIAPEGMRPEDYIIHDSDLLLLVNELKSLGAEAISINDQRIGPNTDIRCAGVTILINSEKVSPPLVIKAIGNPDELEAGLLMPGGVYNTFGTFLNMTIKKEANLVISGYNKFTSYKYATPVVSKEGIQ